MRNTSSTVVIRGAFGAARIIILLIMAGSYLPEQFGQFTLALLFVEIFRVIADMGIDITSILRIASEPQRTSEHMNGIVGFKLLSGGLAVLCAPASHYALYASFEGLVLVLFLTPSLLTGLQVNAFTSYFQARQQMQKIISAHVVGVLVFLALGLGALESTLPLTAVAVAFWAGELATLVLLLRAYKSEGPLRPSLHRHYMVSLLKQSFIVGLSGMCVVVYLRLDNLLIGKLMDEASVGLYAVAARLMEPFQLVFTSLALALYASLSKGWKTASLSDQQALIFRVMSPVIALAFIAVAVLWFAGPAVISRWWPDYLEAGTVLQILCWALVVKALNTQLTAVLNSMGKYHSLFFVLAWNLVAMFILDLLLIPALGLTGAAIAVVAVEGMNAILQFLLVRHYLRERQATMIGQESV